jgi:diguanylate cyclase (GGDEF)-like protein
MLFAVLALFILHLAGGLTFARDGSVNCLGIGLSCVCAAVASYRRSRQSTGVLRTKWALVSLALVIVSFAFILAFKRAYLLREFEHAAGILDFVLYLKGLPLLLAISIPDNDRGAASFAWIDTVQALLAACLAYFVIFSTFPISNTTYWPICDPFSIYAFDIENFGLAAAATLRVFARPTGEESTFYRSLCGFLWAHALVVGFLNYYAIYRWRVPASSILFVAADIPVLTLALAATYCRSQPRPATALATRNSISILIESGSPIFFTLAVLVLAAYIVRAHLYLGIGSIALALLIFGLRTGIVQLHQIRVQHQLRQAKELSEAEALVDSLTGTANRRSFDRTLESEWRRAERTQQPLSLLMIDVDAFKELNDNYGHPKGDECLVLVANALGESLQRPGDFLARYGGEEFAVILSTTDLEGSRQVAKSLRLAVLAAEIPNRTRLGPYVSISVGVARCVPSASSSPETLVVAADEALYRAKRNGRNRVEWSDCARIV